MGSSILPLSSPAPGCGQGQFFFFFSLFHLVRCFNSYLSVSNCIIFLSTYHVPLVFPWIGRPTPSFTLQSRLTRQLYLHLAVHIVWWPDEYRSLTLSRFTFTLSAWCVFFFAIISRHQIRDQVSLRVLQPISVVVYFFLTSSIICCVALYPNYKVYNGFAWSNKTNMA